jgi:hypothetical protein
MTRKRKKNLPRADISIMMIIIMTLKEEEVEEEVEAVVAAEVAEAVIKIITMKAIERLLLKVKEVKITIINKQKLKL